MTAYIMEHHADYKRYRGKFSFCGCTKRFVPTDLHVYPARRVLCGLHLTALLRCCKIPKGKGYEDLSYRL